MTHVRWQATMHGDYIIRQVLQYRNISGEWVDAPTVYDKRTPESTERTEVQLPLDFETPLPQMPKYPDTTNEVVQENVPVGVPKLWL